MKDYYKTLGVNEHASQEEIKRAYRALAHQYHPDKKGGNEARFKEINEAYQTLSDPDRRRQYDQFRAWGGRPRAGGWGGEPFEFTFDMGGLGVFDELLRSFFEGSRSEWSGARTKTRPRQTLSFTWRSPAGPSMTVLVENLEHLSPDMRKKLDDFARKFLEELGGRK